MAALFDAEPGGPLAAALTSAAAAAGRPAPAMPRDMVFIGHSAGAEAAAYAADVLRTTYPRAWHDLRGLILLDPVKSFLGENTDRALADIDATGLPILAVTSPPSPCNDLGLGTTALLTDLHRGFVGVNLPGGSHTDAEGTSTDAMGELLCGAPQPSNVAALQRLTLGWTSDFVNGTRTPGYYPAGPRGDVPAAPQGQPLLDAHR